MSEEEDDINFSVEFDVEEETNLSETAHNFSKRLVEDLTNLENDLQQHVKEPELAEKIMGLILVQKDKIENSLKEGDVINLEGFEDISYLDIDFAMGLIFDKIEELVNPDATVKEKIEFRIDDDMPTQVWAGRRGVYDADEMEDIRGDINSKPSGGIWTSSMRKGAIEYSNWSKWLSDRYPIWRRNEYTKLNVEKGARIFTIRSHKDVELLLDKYMVENQGVTTKVGFPLDWRAMADDLDAIRATGGMEHYMGWDLESAVWLSKPPPLEDAGIEESEFDSWLLGSVTGDRREGEYKFHHVIDSIIKVIQSTPEINKQAREDIAKQDTEAVIKFINEHSATIKGGISSEQLAESIDDIVSNRENIKFKTKYSSKTYTREEFHSYLRRDISVTEQTVYADMVTKIVNEKMVEIQKQITFELGNININIDNRQKMAKKVKRMVARYFKAYVEQVFGVIQMLSNLE